MKAITSTMVLALGLFLMAGCGDDAKKDVAQSIDVPDLMKTWESDCGADPTVKLPAKSFYKFNGSSFTEVHTFYRGENCVKGNESVDITYRGNTSIKPPQEGSAYRPFDLTYREAEVRPYEEVGKKALDAIGLCGQTNWEAGKNVSVADKAGQANCPLKRIPSNEFNIFYFAGDNLSLGYSEVTQGPVKVEDRPKELKKGLLLKKSDREI